MSKNKKIVYSIIIFILFVLFCLTSYLLIYFFRNRDISISREYVNVIDSDSINYTIKLKDNDFITDSSKVSAYATDMIDYLNIYYKFNSKFSDKISGDIDISAVGTLVGTSKTDSSVVLYNEFFNNKDSDYDISGEIINYNDEYRLNFSDIKKIYDSFIDVNKVDLNGIIKFDVTLKYNVYNELINSYVKNSVTLSVNIPLEAETKIECSKTYERNKNFYAKMPKEQKPLYLAICLELFGAIVLFVIIFILIINQMKSQYSKYEKLLDQMLRNRKKRIVRLKALPDLSNRNVVLVKSFKDLEKVNVYKNINYVEIIPNKLSVFFITDNGITYVYNLDAKKVK
jgi:hypothetical protein